MGGSSPLLLPAGSVLFMESQNICSASRQKKRVCHCLLSKNNLFNLIPLKTSPKRELPGYMDMGLIISCISSLMSSLLFNDVGSGPDYQLFLANHTIFK